MTADQGVPGTLQTTDQAMTTGIRALETAAGDCRGVHLMVDEIRGSLSAGWTGEAATRYQNAVHEWLTDLQGVISKIEEMGNLLMSHDASYKRMENDNIDQAMAWIGKELGAAG
ncbi:WXG100 family type VII secretion target [Actinomadura rupiterrae]|uniref:WXG100 family type VII secretion target n=1 Tax=Actinomadura rupiterrae TaxID=559627 RepID=UPI0020A284E2|nr:WXG100 family type VII secretion target [Actinomadura rupiterrae]MCP2336729.1 WXG100 family type VII secretion target [Actinomadura rupiterrae]